MTNRERAATDPLFRKACQLAGVEPTKRQASKWSRKRGLAYDKRREALAAVGQASDG